MQNNDHAFREDNLPVRARCCRLRELIRRRARNQPENSGESRTVIETLTPLSHNNPIEVRPAAKCNVSVNTVTESEGPPTGYHQTEDTGGVKLPVLPPATRNLSMTEQISAPLNLSDCIISAEELMPRPPRKSPLGVAITPQMRRNMHKLHMKSSKSREPSVSPAKPGGAGPKREAAVSTADQEEATEYYCSTAAVPAGMVISTSKKRPAETRKEPAVDCACGVEEELEEIRRYEERIERINVLLGEKRGPELTTVTKAKSPGKTPYKYPMYGKLVWSNTIFDLSKAAGRKSQLVLPRRPEPDEAKTILEYLTLLKRS